MFVGLDKCPLILWYTAGSALIKCGETEKLLGSAEKEFIQSSAINFLTPFRNFIEGDFKTISVSISIPLNMPLLTFILYYFFVLYYNVSSNLLDLRCCGFFSQKERKLLQNKRLDLDAAKNRLKKARVADARSAVSITHAHTHRECNNQHFFSTSGIFSLTIHSQLLQLVKMRYVFREEKFEEWRLSFIFPQASCQLSYALSAV